jgi:hypothetical protein
MKLFNPQSGRYLEVTDQVEIDALVATGQWVQSSGADNYNKRVAEKTEEAYSTGEWKKQVFLNSLEESVSLGLGGGPTTDEEALATRINPGYAALGAVGGAVLSPLNLVGGAAFNGATKLGAAALGTGRAAKAVTTGLAVASQIATEDAIMSAGIAIRDGKDVSSAVLDGVNPTILMGAGLGAGLLSRAAGKYLSKAEKGDAFLAKADSLAAKAEDIAVRKEALGLNIEPTAPRSNSALLAQPSYVTDELLAKRTAASKNVKSLSDELAGAKSTDSIIHADDYSGLAAEVSKFPQAKLAAEIRELEQRAVDLQRARASGGGGRGSQASSVQPAAEIGAIDPGAERSKLYTTFAEERGIEDVAKHTQANRDLSGDYEQWLVNRGKGDVSTEGLAMGSVTEHYKRQVSALADQMPTDIDGFSRFYDDIAGDAGYVNKANPIDRKARRIDKLQTVPPAPDMPAMNSDLASRTYKVGNGSKTEILTAYDAQVLDDVGTMHVYDSLPNQSTKAAYLSTLDPQKRFRVLSIASGKIDEGESLANGLRRSLQPDGTSRARPSLENYVDKFAAKAESRLSDGVPQAIYDGAPTAAIDRAPGFVEDGLPYRGPAAGDAAAIPNRIEDAASYTGQSDGIPQFIGDNKTAGLPVLGADSTVKISRAATVPAEYSVNIGDALADVQAEIKHLKSLEVASRKMALPSTAEGFVKMTDAQFGRFAMSLDAVRTPASTIRSGSANMAAGIDNRIVKMLDRVGIDATQFETPTKGLAAYRSMAKEATAVHVGKYQDLASRISQEAKYGKEIEGEISRASKMDAQYAAQVEKSRQKEMKLSMAYDKATDASVKAEIRSEIADLNASMKSGRKELALEAQGLGYTTKGGGSKKIGGIIARTAAETTAFSATAKIAGGGFLGMAAGRAMGGLTRKIMGQGYSQASKVAMSYEAIKSLVTRQRKIGNALQKAAERMRFIGPASRRMAIANVFRSDDEIAQDIAVGTPPREFIKQVMTEVAKTRKDVPSAAYYAISEFIPEQPAYAKSLSEAVENLYNVISESMPSPTYRGYPSPTVKLSDRQVSDTMRRLDTAIRPADAMARMIEHGTFPTEHLSIIKRVAPDMYVEAVMGVAAQVMETGADGRTVYEKMPSHQRREYSRLMGIPMEAADQPAYILSAAEMYKAERQPKENAPQAMRGSPGSPIAPMMDSESQKTTYR